MPFRLLATAAAVLAAVMSTSAAAQMPKMVPGAPIVARVVAGNYVVDAAHTQVLFTVNHLGFSLYTGEFTNPSGTLTIDPRRLSSAKVDISFPIANVRTTDARLDAHLKNADFFEAAKFPVGRFVSTRVVASGTTAMIHGELTLKGVTRPVVLKARFIGAGNAMMGPPKLNIGFAATTSIKRSEFGIGYGVPMVSDKVDLTINAAFVAP